MFRIGHGVVKGEKLYNFDVTKLCSKAGRAKWARWASLGKFWQWVPRAERARSLILENLLFWLSMASIWGVW